MKVHTIYTQEELLERFRATGETCTAHGYPAGQEWVMWQDGQRWVVRGLMRGMAMLTSEDDARDWVLAHKGTIAIS